MLSFGRQLRIHIDLTDSHCAPTMHFWAVSQWCSSTDGDRCLHSVVGTLLPHTSVYDSLFIHVKSSADIVMTGVRLSGYLSRLSYQSAGMAPMVLEFTPNSGLFESDYDSRIRPEPRKR
jgi:hypothetical protein